MAKTNPVPVATQNRLFIWALGLLVGFVLAFVFVLSRVPVDNIIGQYGNVEERGVDLGDMNFDYYSVLQEQGGTQSSEQRIVAVEPPVVFIEEPPVDVRQDNSNLAEPAIAPAPRIQQISPQQVEQPPQTASSTIQTNPATQAPSQQVQEIVLASETGQDAYYVEAGNYRVNDDALKVLSSLRSLGLDAFIVVRQDNSGTFGHRVRIGPFFDQTRLDETRNRLRSSGIKPRLIRVKG